MPCQRFASSLRRASSRGESHPAVVECARLVHRAFGGETDAWAPLVAAVRRLLAGAAAVTPDAVKSRRDLHAFVAENADLLESSVLDCVESIAFGFARNPRDIGVASLRAPRSAELTGLGRFCGR